MHLQLPAASTTMIQLGLAWSDKESQSLQNQMDKKHKQKDYEYSEEQEWGIINLNLMAKDSVKALRLETTTLPVPDDAETEAGTSGDSAPAPKFLSFIGGYILHLHCC